MQEHETALLGAILHKIEIIDELVIIPEMFYDPAYRSIFEAICETRKNVNEVSKIAISDTLRIRKQTDLIVILADIKPWTAANAKYYAEKLRENMQRRYLTSILKDALTSLEKPSEDLQDAIRMISNGLVEIEKAKQETEDPSLEKTFPKYCKELERRLLDDGKSGATFGIEPLDNMLGSNIQLGELIAIAARPGVGKTALAIQLAIYNATRRGIPATIFSLEMTRDEVYDRIYAPVVVGGLTGLRGGYVIKSKPSMDRMFDLTKKIHASGIRIFQESMTPESICSHIRRDRMVYDTKLFIVDYLGLINFGTDTYAARWEKVGDLSRALKRLALDIRVTILMCVQLGRQAEGKPPTLADLRDSGAIEQDCNRVFLLHREGEVQDNGDCDTSAIAAKNRGGRIGKVPLVFHGCTGQFEAK
jgi:replicative DNA helicase